MVDLMTWSQVTRPPQRGPQGQGFTYRGAYAANTAYATYDVVTYQGSVYLAPSAFTSGATFDATKWTLWAAKGDPGASGTVGTAQSPLVLDTNRNLSFSRSTSLYNATKTYFPGETVTLWDGSFWEAMSNVPVNEPPLLHNLLPNASFENADISNFWSNVSTSAVEGTYTVSQATDSGSSAKVLQIAKTAGAGNTTLDQILGWVSMGSVPWQTMTNARFRVKSSVALSYQLVQQATDSYRQSRTQVIGAMIAVPANTWTDVTFSTTDYGFSALQENQSFLRLVGLRVLAMPQNAAVTVQIDTMVATEAYRGDGPSQFFTAGFPVPLSATQAAAWQGGVDISRTSVSSGLWRFIGPGRGRPGAFPVQLSSFQGDLVFEAEPGSRTIGVF